MPNAKRWKTVEWPTVVEKKHPSQVAAYRHVAYVRGLFLDGRSRVNKMVVWFSEDKGVTWQRYENLNLND